MPFHYFKVSFELSCLFANWQLLLLWVKGLLFQNFKFNIVIWHIFLSPIEFSEKKQPLAVATSIFQKLSPFRVGRGHLSSNWNPLILTAASRLHPMLPGASWAPLCVSLHDSWFANENFVKPEYHWSLILFTRLIAGAAATRRRRAALGRRTRPSISSQEVVRSEVLRYECTVLNFRGVHS